MSPHGTIQTNNVTLGLGVAWAQHQLTVVNYGPRVVILDGLELVRVLTLEPGRKYYPQLLPKS